MFILCDKPLTNKEFINHIKNEEFAVATKRKKFGKYYKKIEYIDVPCAFDIEVSSFYDGDEKRSIVYSWQFGINGIVTMGRTLESFRYFINNVRKVLNINDCRILPIYVHNLAYEFQFIRYWFRWESIFAREERKAFKANTDDGFEFRCSYALSGCGLEQVGKNLLKYKVDKKVGDLDYSVIRTPETPLTDKEIGYCVNDVLVDMAYIQECIERFGDITKIPMTKTGIVRNYCREKCLETKGYRKLINSLTINGMDEYSMLKRAFQGGYTHANYKNVSKTFENVKSYDFTSSYPAVMVSEKFPMSSGELMKGFTEKDIHIDPMYCYIFNVQIEGLKSLHKGDHYLSSSKCYNVQNPVYDNGRLISADMLQSTMTELDLDIIRKTYKTESIKIGRCYRYIKTYLPTPFVKCVIDFYKDKTTLKDVEGMEVEYYSKKEMTNSTYGMTVTDIVNDTVIYDNQKWDKEEADTDDCISKYNKDRKRFLFYPWGVFVTAYARYNLWKGIMECGDDYIYSDTDSIKILNYEKHKDFIERYNKEIMYKMKKACETHGIPFDFVKPKTVKGVEKPLGVWDDDGYYKRFKTLGAKRYMVEYEEDGETKYKITVAGVNKKQGSKYISMQKNPFEYFDDMMIIPKEYSGRIVCTYLDNSFDGVIMDYKGNKYEYHERSGIHMENSDYHLTMTPIYLALIGGKTEVSYG